ncbi:DUF2163 domain-containing protein [Oricola sp.]|uniref:DUF2163 domain-containing protein n=1 Tax=Oricola sp. TaxID=1979950 RepID=UPI003BAC46D6
MSSLPQALADHLGQPTTTVCYCWIVNRRDGMVLGFTDHDQPLNLNETVCEPATGFSAGDVESELGLSAGTSEVVGALSSDRISEADIRAGKYHGASIERYLVNWSNPSNHALLTRHVVGEVRTMDGAFRVELRGMTSRLDEERGRLFMRSCDADLGDARCGFDVSDPAYSADGSVVAVGGGGVTVSGLAGYAERWFDLGRLSWTTGARVGLSDTVLSVSVTASTGERLLRLFDPELEGIAPGDTFNVVAGCDKAFSTCKAKFSNPLNFQGFPHIPGNDAALTYVDGETEFDGGPIIP